jgi:hypothetical protein
MPRFNYGGRIGMASIIKGVQFVCRIYGVYQDPIISYINGSTLSTDQKTALINWLNLATASCGLLMSLKFAYE